jgi:osmotically-inducible protein OsmY
MARYDERSPFRDDENDWRDRDRDERRFRGGGQERGRYEASDWDRDRYREAPEYRHGQSYGGSRGYGNWNERDRDYNDRERGGQSWRSGNNPGSGANEPWGHDDSWRASGRTSDYGRYGSGGEGRPSQQYGQSYGSGSFGSDYGNQTYGGPNYGGYGGQNYGGYGGQNSGNQSRWSEHRGSEQGRWTESAGRTTLRGIGSPSDSEGGWSRSSNEETRRGGFYGKGPRGYTRSDERIREDICDRLSADDEVDASDITVTVAKTEVTLEGSVPDRHSKRRAEDIAESVTGVTEVHNRLRSNKGVMQEVGDKIMGRGTEGGHAGSGTRNAPAGTGGTQNLQNNH